MNSLNWDDLKIFLAIAHSGTLSGAAKAVGQSQPTMGRRIRVLEQSIGQTLFQRTGDGFLLTDSGLAVLEHVERMEDEANGFARKLAGHSELEGTLRISTTEWFALHVLTPIASRFSIHNPRLTLELVTETRLVNLSRREADLVFRFRTFDEPDVVQRKVMHATFGLYGAQEYLQRVAFEPQERGKGQALITMDSAYADLADVSWLDHHLPLAHKALRANSRDVQALLCSQGAGLAVLPTCFASRIPNLVLLDLGEPPPGRDIWAGYHRDLKRSRPLRAFLQAVQDENGCTLE